VNSVINKSLLYGKGLAVTHIY